MMNKQDNTLSQAKRWRGLGPILVNWTVLAALLAALIPVLFIGLSLPSESLSTETLLAWLGGAALFALFIGAIVAALTQRDATTALHDFATALAAFNSGDLKRRITTENLDPNTEEGRALTHIAVSINQILDRVQHITHEIRQALTRMDEDTRAILEVTSQQINMANEQDNVVTETTATVNEVRATVTETAERAQSVAETAQVSVDISRTGTDAVTETIAGMDLIRRRVEDIADNILELSEHTQQIGEIIATVNSLADQSRMLALNASVEAARAGEEGKGFAVVALEVRNLADQNRDATVQVREILGEIQRATNGAVMVTEEGSKGVDHGQSLVNRAGDAIRDLSQAIEEAAMAAMQIAASTRQQTIGVDQLTQAMRTIKHSTAEMVTSTMQVENSVQRLRQMTDNVNAVLADIEL